jgi:hypothetical protein
LDEELVAPTVECLKTLGVVHIIHKNTAVSSPVESNAQRLETFLPGGIPDLSIRG